MNKLVTFRQTADKWISSAGDYITHFDWHDIGLVKLAACAAGVLFGLCVPKNRKKLVLFGALTVLFITSIPLILRAFRTFFSFLEDRRS